MEIAFTKYHALGNDYIVINPKDLHLPLTTEQVKTICHRNFGIGSDGILLGPLPAENARYALKIYNPDGSLAEKSGNGLRIFSRYLWDSKLVGEEEFAIQTDGGVVRSTVFDGGRMVRVEMGKVSFDSEKIPVTGAKREVINEKISVGGREFVFCAATIGNPHCVIIKPAGEFFSTTPIAGQIESDPDLFKVSAALAHKFGPLLEVHPIFPRKTNVQFLK